MAHNPTGFAQERDEFRMPPEHAFPADAGEGGRHALVPAHLLALARRIAHGRHVRDRLFGPSLCVNPPWNILIELFVAAEEGRSVTIKSACVAAGVPQSTALRHIAHLVDIGLCVRSQHPNDARSAHLKLSASAHGRMVDFLNRIAEPADARGG